jgi:hypothetical protein
MALNESSVRPHKVIIHRWGQKLFDKHRQVLEQHKEKGPAFRQAAENLERTFETANRLR